MLRPVSTKLSFGEYVRHLRRKRNWGLQELAQASGLSFTHLSRLENDNAIPNADTVVKLATALEGDLEQMLALADCLPKEILERLTRRVSRDAESYRRTAGPPADPGFPRALVEDIDPGLRAAIAKRFGLSEHDVDGLFNVLQKLSRMNSTEREAILTFLASHSGSEDQGDR